MASSDYYNSHPSINQYSNGYPQQPSNAYQGDQSKGWGNQQGGYYPQQPQYMGPPQGYYAQQQPNPYMNGQPQTVYVQQQPNRGGGDMGCLACCAGMAACCCLEELCLF